VAACDRKVVAEEKRSGKQVLRCVCSCGCLGWCQRWCQRWRWRCAGAGAGAGAGKGYDDIPIAHAVLWRRRALIAQLVSSDETQGPMGELKLAREPPSMEEAHNQSKGEAQSQQDHSEATS